MDLRKNKLLEDLISKTELGSIIWQADNQLKCYKAALKEGYICFVEDMGNSYSLRISSAQDTLLHIMEPPVSNNSNRIGVETLYGKVEYTVSITLASATLDYRQNYYKALKIIDDI